MGLKVIEMKKRLENDRDGVEVGSDTYEELIGSDRDEELIGSER